MAAIFTNTHCHLFGWLACMLAHFCHTYVSNVTTLLATQNLLYLHTLLHSRLWAAYNIKAFYTRYSGSDVLCVFGSLSLSLCMARNCVYLCSNCVNFIRFTYSVVIHTAHNTTPMSKRVEQLKTGETDNEVVFFHHYSHKIETKRK